jgi:nucleoside-diphosphate-sugar epimerase
MEHNAAAGSFGPRRTNIDLTGSRVLVTGATGFLGQHLVPRLVRAGAGKYYICNHPSFRSPAVPGQLNPSQTVNDAPRHLSTVSRDITEAPGEARTASTSTFARGSW